MFKKILIANDGSEGARHALKVAIDLAKKYGEELYSISVEEGVPHYAATIGEVDEYKKEANGFFKKLNDEAVEEAKKEGIELHPGVLAGHEVETIVHYAKGGILTFWSSALWGIQKYSAECGVRPHRT